MLATSSFAGLSDAATVKGRGGVGTLKGLASDRGNSLRYPPWLRRESIRGFCWLAATVDSREEGVAEFIHLLANNKNKDPKS